MTKKKKKPRITASSIPSPAAADREIPALAGLLHKIDIE